MVLTPGCIWNKWGTDHFNYDHCEYNIWAFNISIRNVAIIGVSEVVRISVITNWPQKYFLRRIFVISLQMHCYCEYLQFRSNCKKNAKIVTNLEFATKYATKKNKHLLLKNVPKPRQILNLRQISVCSNKIFSPLDHGTYSCLCVVWILHSCTRWSFISFLIYHTEGINISDFCLRLFTDLNQHDIEFITASDNTIPIWISLCANPAHHPKCILAFRGEDEEKGEGDYSGHHYYH